MQSTALSAVWLLCFACLVAASAGAADTHCDRAKRYETLRAQDQQTLQGDAQVIEVNTHTGSAYHMGYVYQLVPYPPALVMAVFTTYEDQRGYITDVLEAKIEAQRGNYARVRFVYDLPWPLPNSEYVVNNTVVQEGETYLLSWDLHPSSPRGLSAPQYVEGYFRTQPVGPRTLIIYCQYVIPGTGLLPGTVNRAGLKAMQTAGEAERKQSSPVCTASPREPTPRTAHPHHACRSCTHCPRWVWPSQKSAAGVAMPSKSSSVTGLTRETPSS